MLTYSYVHSTPHIVASDMDEYELVLHAFLALAKRGTEHGHPAVRRFQRRSPQRGRRDQNSRCDLVPSCHRPLAPPVCPSDLAHAATIRRISHPRPCKERPASQPVSRPRHIAASEARRRFDRPGADGWGAVDRREQGTSYVESTWVRRTIHSTSPGGSSVSNLSFR